MGLGVGAGLERGVLNVRETEAGTVRRGGWRRRRKRRKDVYGVEGECG